FARCLGALGNRSLWAGAGQPVPVFVHPPYCVETPPGTRYNPPFNISENLFFNRSNRYKEPKMNPARKKPSLLFSSLLFSSLLFSSLLFSSLLFRSAGGK
ncbi:hypothetical protein ACKXTT_001694, partial [Neisseria gonorrhoeae]